MRNRTLRRCCLPLAVLATLSLSACGGSTKDTGAPRQATATVPLVAAGTPRPKPGHSSTALTKAQFVTRMEAVCTDVTTRLSRLPQNPQDTTGVIEQLQAILTLYPPYLVQADALVNRSADKAKLVRNWLGLEKSDFAAAKPVFAKLVADSKAGDRATLLLDAQALESLPRHGMAIAGFLSGYGMTSCAHLQSS